MGGVEWRPFGLPRPPFPGNTSKVCYFSFLFRVKMLSVCEQFFNLKMFENICWNVTKVHPLPPDSIHRKVDFSQQHKQPSHSNLKQESLRPSKPRFQPATPYAFHPIVNLDSNQATKGFYRHESANLRLSSSSPPPHHFLQPFSSSSASNLFQISPLLFTTGFLTLFSQRSSFVSLINKNIIFVFLLCKLVSSNSVWKRQRSSGIEGGQKSSGTEGGERSSGALLGPQDSYHHVFFQKIFSNFFSFNELKILKRHFILIVISIFYFHQTL